MQLQTVGMFMLVNMDDTFDLVSTVRIVFLIYEPYLICTPVAGTGSEMETFVIHIFTNMYDFFY